MDKLPIDVYMPAGYDASERRYPVVYVHDGPNARERGRWPVALDNLIGRGVEGILPAEQRIESVFKYPVLDYPLKVKSFNLDRNPRVDGMLMGIKGQYLIFDTGVINLRKYSGYNASLQGMG